MVNTFTLFPTHFDIIYIFDCVKFAFTSSIVAGRLCCWYCCSRPNDMENVHRPAHVNIVNHIVFVCPSVGFRIQCLKTLPKMRKTNSIVQQQRNTVSTTTSQHYMAWNYQSTPGHPLSRKLRFSCGCCHRRYRCLRQSPISADSQQPTSTAITITTPQRQHGQYCFVFLPTPTPTSPLTPNPTP